MSLADEALRGRTRKGPGCDTGLLLDRLTEPDRSELLEALADPTVQATALARVLRARGYDIGSWSLQRHRREACRCR
jgi:hypothetical protein